MSDSLATPVIVENKSGVNGAIGSVHMSTLAINPLIYRNLGHQSQELTPLSQAVTFANILVAPASLPVNSLAELLHYMRAKVAALNFASQGNGSSGHLEDELLNRAVGARDACALHRRRSCHAGPAFGQRTADVRDRAGGHAYHQERPHQSARRGERHAPAAGFRRAADLDGAQGLRGHQLEWHGGAAAPATRHRRKLNEHIVRAPRSTELARLAQERGVIVVAARPRNSRA